MIRWSSTPTCRISPACTMDFVASISSELASVDPEGWLWATIIEALLSSKGSRNSSPYLAHTRQNTIRHSYTPRKLLPGGFSLLRKERTPNDTTHTMSLLSRSHEKRQQNGGQGTHVPAVSR